MVVKKLERVFMLDKKELADPNAKMKDTEVVDFYSNQFPELANGFVESSSIDEKGRLVVKLKTAVGTKG